MRVFRDGCAILERVGSESVPKGHLSLIFQ